MNIYFVCTGNTCRSPMAAAILAQKNIEGIAVKSAGVYAGEGEPISHYAQMTLVQKQIFASHISSQVNEPDLEWADIILTMTTRHKQLLVQGYSEYASKIYTLNEYIFGQAEDVMDPYGGDLSIYEQTYAQLAAAIDQLVIKLQKGV